MKTRTTVRHFDASNLTVCQTSDHGRLEMPVKFMARAAAAFALAAALALPHQASAQVTEGDASSAHLTIPEPPTTIETPAQNGLLNLLGLDDALFSLNGSCQCAQYIRMKKWNDSHGYVASGSTASSLHNNRAAMRARGFRQLLAPIPNAVVIMASRASVYRFDSGKWSDLGSAGHAGMITSGFQTYVESHGVYFGFEMQSANWNFKSHWWDGGCSNVNRDYIAVPFGSGSFSYWIQDSRYSRVYQGDANGDHHVNSLDYSILLQEYGSQRDPRSNPLLADFNGDGRVDILDLETVRRNYGS